MSTKAELESRIWEEINRPAKDIDIPKLKKMLNCADEQPLSARSIWQPFPLIVRRQLMRFVRQSVILVFCLVFSSVCSLAESYTNIIEMKLGLLDNPHWIKSYEAYGRTIDVNIPIIIPDVSAFPIVKVIPHSLFEEETSCKLQIKDSYTGAVNEADLYSASVYDSVLIKMNAPSDLLSYYPKDFLKYEKTCYYPWEVEGKEQEIFAENNPFSLSDAEYIVKEIIDDLYGENEGYSLEYIEIRGRAHKTKSDVDFNLGDTVDYYPYGSYYLSLRPTVNNIPVYATSIRLFDSDLCSKNKVYDDDFARLSSLTMFVDLMDTQSLHLKTILLLQQEVLIENSSLSPISTVIESIEQEIMAGRVRNVYSLRLGYVCFLNESSPQSYTLFPTWLCECDYTKTEKEDGSVYILDAGIRDGTKFELLGINAITGEVFDRRTPSQKSLYCPQ